MTKPMRITEQLTDRADQTDQQRQEKEMEYFRVFPERLFRCGGCALRMTLAPTTRNRSQLQHPSAFKGHSDDLQNDDVAPSVAPKTNRKS